MLRETPEFSSYQRVYSAIWPAVEELILHLQEICTQYAVPLAVVDGKVGLLGRCEAVELHEGFELSRTLLAGAEGQMPAMGQLQLFDFGLHLEDM